MSETTLEDESGTQPHLLPLWGRVTLGLWLSAAALVLSLAFGLALEDGGTAVISSVWFLALVGFVLVLESGIFVRIVSETRRSAGSEPVTLATWVTVTRGAASAVLAGFIVVPRPDGVLVWAPAILFAAGAALDAVDGLLARRTETTTALGARVTWKRTPDRAHRDACRHRSRYRPAGVSRGRPSTLPVHLWLLVATATRPSRPRVTRESTPSPTGCTRDGHDLARPVTACRSRALADGGIPRPSPVRPQLHSRLDRCRRLSPLSGDYCSSANSTLEKQTNGKVSPRQNGS